MAKAYIDTRATNDRDLYIILENVTMQGDWSRFGGQVNANGKMQHFCEVHIDDPAVAQFLKDNDFPVKIWVPKNSPDAEPQTHMKVMLPYDDNPSKSWLTPAIKLFNMQSIGSSGVDITKDNVAELDKVRIDHANLRLRYYKGRTPLGQDYVHAQLVYGEFYTSGEKMNTRTDLTAPIESGQNPNEDVPF